jgi:hypothetical protein
LEENETETKLGTRNVYGNASTTGKTKEFLTVLYNKNKQGKRVGIPGGVRSKAQDWGRLIAGIAGSNSAQRIDVRLLCLFSVEIHPLLVGADPPYAIFFYKAKYFSQYFPFPY